MIGKGKSFKRICVYCQYEANSEDHIPSKNLFMPESRNSINFIKVDACKKCNEGFSKDEEYFRNLFVTIAQDRSDVASGLFYSKVKRSIEKRSSLGHMLTKNMSLVEICTPSGISIGKRTKIELSNFDTERIFNVINKYTKGLSNFHFGYFMPDNYIIRHKWIDKNDPIDENIRFKWNVVDKNTFIYGFTRIPNTYQSIWLFVFYGLFFFNSIIIKKDSEWASKIKGNIFSVKPDPF